MSNQLQHIQWGKQAYDKARTIHRQVDQTLDDILNVHKLMTQPDVATYEKLSNRVWELVEKNPVGKAMSRYYEPHRRILIEALKAAETIDKLTESIEKVNLVLRTFDEESGNLTANTAFDRSRFQEGPLRFGAYLWDSATKKGQQLTWEQIHVAVSIVQWWVRNKIKWLDRLIGPYAKLINNYERMSIEAQDKLTDQMETGNVFARLFASTKGTNLTVHFYALKDANLKRRLQDGLIHNRNAWAEWLGVSGRQWTDYLKDNEAE